MNKTKVKQKTDSFILSLLCHGELSSSVEGNKKGSRIGRRMNAITHDII